MRSDIASLWLFALALKCKSLHSTNFLSLISIVSLAWFIMALIYWIHPGGPAWGKHKWRRSSSSIAKPIPGPKGLPFIGSMNLMVGLAHHKIAAMAKSCQATRLMAFSIGETRAIVTCNPYVAKEILNSSVFADRPVKESAYGLMFNRAIGFAPYGVYWRSLRKISAAHLFCPKQIKSLEPQRLEICNQIVVAINKSRGYNICVRDVLKRASLNYMMRSIFGQKYGLHSYNEETEELRSLVEEGYDLLGVLNWSDHLPWLRKFDLQKIRFRCFNLVPKVDRFISRIIAQNRAQTGEADRDFVHVLLSLEGAEKLSDSDMIAVLWEMIFRGTDTVAILIEWVIARMVLHPHVQSTVQNELDLIVGKSRGVTENDVAKMVYLPAVVKEVLRLHPPGPLLSWSRLSITDTVVDGCHVPAGTTAMVNMWAITRDPEIWSDPLEFKPERFLNGEGDDGFEFSVMGSDLRLAPFGSGRRTCPGKALGLTTVSFWVASLLHEFEWGSCGQQETVDLSEVLRLSCEMANPLSVSVRPRRVSSLSF